MLYGGELSKCKKKRYETRCKIHGLRLCFVCRFGAFGRWWLVVANRLSMVCMALHVGRNIPTYLARVLAVKYAHIGVF